MTGLASAGARMRIREHDDVFKLLPRPAIVAQTSWPGNLDSHGFSGQRAVSARLRQHLRHGSCTALAGSQLRTAEANSAARAAGPWLKLGEQGPVRDCWLRRQHLGGPALRCCCICGIRGIRAVPLVKLPTCRNRLHLKLHTTEQDESRTNLKSEHLHLRLNLATAACRGSATKRLPC